MPLPSTQLAIIQRMPQPPYPKIKAAGDSLGFPFGTVKRWNSLPEFREALATAIKENQDEILEEVRMRMRGILPKSFDTMVETLDAHSEFARYRAAAWLLEKAMGKAKETKDASGLDGGPIAYTTIPEHFQRMTDEELAELVNHVQSETGEA